MNYQEQIKTLSNQIAAVLKSGIDPIQYATALINENDEDDGHYEVSARDSKTNTPHTFRL